VKIPALMTLSRGCIVAISLTLAACAAEPQPASDAIMPAPQQISEHAWAWIGPLEGPSKENHGYRMNLGFVAGKDAVVVVDSGYTKAIAQEMLAHIRKITDVPVKYVVNTNSQPHRFMGNDVFREAGAQVIANKRSAERMAERGGMFAQIIENILETGEDSVQVPAAPDVLLEEDMKLDLGGLEVVVKPFGAGHTPAQLVVSVPADNLVFTGDILYQGRMLAVLNDSSVPKWLQAYEDLRQFGDATFVPGHGEPAKLEAFDFSTRQYLQTLYDHVQKCVDDGTGLQDAIASFDSTAWSQLVNFEELAGRNVSWAYIEREKAFFAN